MTMTMEALPADVLGHIMTFFSYGSSQGRTLRRVSHSFRDAHDSRAHTLHMNSDRASDADMAAIVVRTTQMCLRRILIEGLRFDNVACLVAPATMALVELDLSNTRVVDVSDLASFARLTSLNLAQSTDPSAGKMLDVDAVAALTGLTYLNLERRCDIVNLDHVLGALTGLQELNLAHTRATSWSKDVVATLTRLTRLEIQRPIYDCTWDHTLDEDVTVYADDLSPLSALERLTYLDITARVLTVLPTGITTLTYLGCCNIGSKCDADGWEDDGWMDGLTAWIPTLTRLGSMNCTGNLVFDGSFIPTGLGELRIAGHEFTDNNLHTLSGLTSLTLLDISDGNGDELLDVSPLSALTSLTTLHMSDIHQAYLVDLSPLSALTRLKELKITNRLGSARLGSVQGPVNLGPLAGISGLRIITNWGTASWHRAI